MNTDNVPNQALDFAEAWGREILQTFQSLPPKITGTAADTPSGVQPKRLGNLDACQPNFKPRPLCWVVKAVRSHQRLKRLPLDVMDEKADAHAR